MGEEISDHFVFSLEEEQFQEYQGEHWRIWKTKMRSSTLGKLSFASNRKDTFGLRRDKNLG